MNKTSRHLFLGALVIFTMAIWSLSSISQSFAQQKSEGIWQQIQGNWSLVSVVNEVEGKKTDAYGPNPKGSMMITSEGRFSIITLRSDLPKFAANNKYKGTNEENKAVVQGAYAIYGTCSVLDEKEHMISLSIEGSMYPNIDGEVQKRIMNVTGDVLKMINPYATIGGTNYLIWKRIQ